MRAILICHCNQGGNLQLLSAQHTCRFAKQVGSCRIDIQNGFFIVYHHNAVTHGIEGVPRAMGTTYNMRR